MRTAAAYIRVSTDDQTEFSPDAQLKRIKEYAASHDILLLPDHIYTELGVSGRSAARRPRFMALMTAAKRKPRPFDVVLIHAFDRRSRKTAACRNDPGSSHRNPEAYYIFSSSFSGYPSSFRR